MFKTLFLSVYYQLLITLRIKQAVFFSIVFPVFLFVVFCNLWGAASAEYVTFLLSGIIGMTIASDGLYAIGPVIKAYYDNGMIKYLRKQPFNILVHFLGLIISRVLTLFVVVLLLCSIAYFVFDTSIGWENVVRYLIGVLIGLSLFSFLGLIVNFSGIKKGADKGASGFVYFSIIFTSNAFYPVGELNSTIGTIGNMLPLNPILLVLRQGQYTWALLFWCVVPMAVFYALFYSIDMKR